MTTWHWLAMAGIFGVLAGWVLASVRMARLHAQASALGARGAELEVQIARLDAALVAERAKNSEAGASLATVTAENTHLLQRLAEDGTRLVEIQERMKLEFENLAGRLLEEKSAKFLEQNQQHLGTLLNPLRERLGEFRERMEKIHTEEEKSAAALGFQLKSLHELNRQMAEEAGNLTSALKGQSKTQGSWGELVLERILEKCGLTKGVEYETQTSYQDDDGSRRMPDVVIHLPEGKNLIIDAKVSLTAYEKAVNAASEGLRASALREHVLSVRRHVEELAKKDYPGLKSLQSPDFVLMFVPVEPALHLALQEDPALYGDAFEKNVVLVSSSTLLIALRAVESVWRHHKQTINAQEIARQAGNLHDAFVNFTQSLEEIGSRLDQAKAAYDAALSRLATGRGNLVKRTIELQKLGARSDKQLPSGIAALSEE
jgi:DNA recombination protein RmuC